MIFVILIVVIIFGVFVERMNFFVYLIFIILWLLFVYFFVVYWVWGDGGWLCNFGVFDFVGGNVVYISLGVIGLVFVIMIGCRKEVDFVLFYNLFLVFIGGILVWFGWYGFNVGSVFIIDNVVMIVFVNMNIVVVVGIIGWGLVEWLMNKKLIMFGIIFGVIVGLVFIIFVVGFVIVLSLFIIGFFGGVLCFWVVFWLKGKVKYDDVFDVFGFYGIGGIWGGIVIGFFVIIKVNEVGVDGLFYGNVFFVVK